MNKPVIIIGNGGHSSVLVETLLNQQREIIGYTDFEKSQECLGLKYLGPDEVVSTDYMVDQVELVLGLGTIKASLQRQNLFNFFRLQGFKFASVIHPTAIISSSTQLGEGVQIMAGAILQANVYLGTNTIINTGAIIDHGCKIGSHVHIAPGSVLSGDVIIGEGCLIGIGTSIIQSIIIGSGTTIGAGSVVVNDIGIGKTAYGVPAKEV